MNFWDFIPQIANQLGIQPSQLLFYIGFVTFAANIGARLIPQDATGKLGTLRRVCAVVGAYVPSRVTGTISVTDVARAVVTDTTHEVQQNVQDVVDAAGKSGSLIPQVAHEALDLNQYPELKPAFPGLVGKAIDETDSINHS